MTDENADKNEKRKPLAIDTAAMEKLLKDEAKTVESDLAKCFKRPFNTPDTIISAMKYSLFAGGKRIRPILMRQVCQMFGGNLYDIEALSCAIEMIHTYSLIHDDLPAMDDDDLRRGKPTNHKVFGEDMAILAGDALLNFAVETALSGITRLKVEQVRPGLKALEILMKAAGVDGMIGGQVGDLLAEGDAEAGEEMLYFIHRHKTGALLKAAIMCGATMGGADEKSMKALSDYGDALGMTFQIVDDILDVTSDTETLGKPVGSDAEENKLTFVSLYGLESAKIMAEEYYFKSLDALSGIRADVDTSFLRDLATYLYMRSY